MPILLFSTPPLTPNSDCDYEKCTILRKTDILVNEKVKSIQNVQVLLSNVLSMLYVSSDEVTPKEVYVAAKFMKNFTDEGVLKLKVLMKINNELQLMRDKLQGPCCKDLCMKRIHWLEHRIMDIATTQSDLTNKHLMQNICEQYLNDFLHGRVTNQSLASTYLSQFPEYVHPGFSSVTRTPNPSPVDMFYTDPIGYHVNKEDTNTNQTIAGDQENTAIFPSQESQTTTSDNDSKSANQIFVDDRPRQHVIDTDMKNQSEIKQLSSSVFDRNSAVSSSSSLTQGALRRHTAPLASIKILNSDDAPPLSAFLTDVNIIERRKTFHVLTPKPHSRKTAIITSKLRDHLKASFRKTKKIPSLTTQCDVRKGEVDIGRTSEDKSIDRLLVDYWSTEHHRYVDHPTSRVIAKKNPLSYHNMDLFLPGSFLTKKPPSSTNWPHKPENTHVYQDDPYNVALRTLGGRVQKISNEVQRVVYDSLSENIQKFHQPSDGVTTAKRRSSYPSSSLQISKEIPQRMTSPSITRQLRKDFSNKRLDTTHSGRLVYYPNPIPRPIPLPLTRTSDKAVYPRLPTSFCTSSNESTCKSRKLIDQGSLYGDTKISLFKPKTSLSHSCNKRQVKAYASTDFRRSRRCLKLNKPEQYVKELMKVTDKSLRLSSANALNDDTLGMKWQRVKELLEKLTSNRMEERSDAARHLGLLGCPDNRIYPGLKLCLGNEDDPLCQYEATKSLILLGCWDDDVLSSACKILQKQCVLSLTDLLDSFSEGKKFHSRNKEYAEKTQKLPSLPKFVNILRSLTHNTNNVLSFSSAICLAQLDRNNSDASLRLKTALENNADIHSRAKALETLIKTMNIMDSALLPHILSQLNTSPVWRYRLAAAEYLVYLGVKKMFNESNEANLFYELERRLWDEPVHAVRLAVAKAISSLNLYQTAIKNIKRKLQSNNDEVRVQAIISMGSLGMKDNRSILQLLELLDLDPSKRVRSRILRTLRELKTSDKRVLRVLKEKYDGI